MTERVARKILALGCCEQEKEGGLWTEGRSTCNVIEGSGEGRRRDGSEKSPGEEVRWVLF